MSDSISELLCVFIQELKLAVTTVYRPPGTNNESFNLVLNKMDEWLNNLHGELKDVDVLIIVISIYTVRMKGNEL